MTKISDVAHEAGVSISTVSRALNGQPTVDAELVKRVKRAARKLGYRPNAIARSLRMQSTTVWTLVLPDVENPFFTSISRGVEDVALRNGYSLVLCNSDEDPEKEQHYLHVAVAQRSAGVIVAPARPDTDLSLLERHDIPVIAVDRTLRSRSTDSVVVRSRSAAQEGVSHLIDEGWSRIACVTGTKGVLTADERLAGWRMALRRAGRTPDRNLVARADFRSTGGYQATKQLLEAGTQVDAFFVTNNLMGLGALQAIQEAGLQPGRDVGVLIFDGLPWAQLLRPPISVITQPTYEIGRMAGEMLLSRLRDPDRPVQRRSLRGELVIRPSSLRSGHHPKAV